MPRGRPKKQVAVLEAPIPKKRGRPKKVVAVVNPLPQFEEPPPKVRKVFKKTRKPRKKGFLPRELCIPDPNATPEEDMIRREKLSEMLPKIDPNKPRTIINLEKDAKECAELTKTSCHRPDIYLDYGCWHCKLSKHCACKLNHTKKIRK